MPGHIMVKGGIWKNTEDEILKVAVMKYGKNQWSRISSLLVRKSAKQCKSRWFEWLDPSIKKTEWTREEEEKLLHLAKIMPTQWRTIAPIIGRTASQCLEHYEKLLDAAQDRDIARKDDPRRLRPGEIDPNPEAKPARPDAVDMDEDEKEMLSEARARLANTLGKRAKRRAREKQLEEARRLAMLQKRRELRAAGVRWKRRRPKRTEMDFNAEIPYQKSVPAGFFDTTQDQRRTAAVRKDVRSFVGKELRELEGESMSEREHKERQRDAKRQKLHSQVDAKAMAERLNKLNDPAQIRRRSRMVLPAPQINDEEMEEIARLGGLEALASTAGGLGGAGMLRTPLSATRTPMVEDTVMLEAQRMAAFTETQTPLKGGESTPLGGMDFSGIQPKSRDIATPNMYAQLAAAAATPRGGVGGMTPLRTPMAVGATPVRDSLRINNEGEDELSSNRREQRQQAKQLRERLSAQFASLPKPNDEYSLSMPPPPPAAAGAVAAIDGDDEDEDMESVDRRREREQQEARERLLLMRTQAIQRRLPHPLSSSSSSSSSPSLFSSGGGGGVNNDEYSLAQKLITSEMISLLKHDIEYKDQTDINAIPQRIEDRDLLPNELAEAAQLINQETDDDESSLLTITSLVQTMENNHQHRHAAVVRVPRTGEYKVFSSLPNDDKLAVLREEHTSLLSWHKKLHKSNNKLLKKVTIVTKGYTTRMEKLAEEINSLYEDIDEQREVGYALATLERDEEFGMHARINALQRDVALVHADEKLLQQEYASLLQSS